MADKSASRSPSASDALAQLQQPQSLKLLSIAEALSPKEHHPESSQKRSSAVSDDSEQSGDTHPAVLQADLLHYKELFGKLRFSYVEQVTKEKFLRGITDNPPRLIEAPDNDAKEREVLALKAALKEHKLEVAEILRQLEAKGRDLALRYESVQLRTQELASLPPEVKGLEASIESLKREQIPPSTNPELALSLPDTVRLLEQREADLAALDAELSKLQSSLPSRTRELEKLERELKPLETQKHGTVGAAKEARRRKEDGGGIGDELEEKGRWLTASGSALSSMLET
ncbi:hypothetical protein BU23DRAFT_307348 [Bimuria novae-zelandiae CBS 107.79]|uniref:Kinetochore protein Sos7 coiled-coil domain-containing protein n=1 Tax=Bimuria novae-zelandiae CBS 107.79 TaxID=1447943 RepID=A0A6A5UPT0_9PLEO|nr:hypothetical protein BU23DRAFT_307348 [Bimuria novae-zelandiae CBS 107.79]